MKKCMICGGQTLAGAKLCMPCRAALRRARDDTISELLPLPRRREVFAFSNSPGIGGRAPTAHGAPHARSRRSTPAARPRRLTAAQLHAAAVIAFVGAAGLLIFVLAHQFLRARPVPAVAVRAQAVAPAGETLAPRVSPSAMLGAARDESKPSIETPIAEATPPPPPQNRVDRRLDRPTKARASAARTQVAPDPLPAVAPIEAPPAVAPAIAVPAPVAAPVIRAPAPDRAQQLATALAGCTGDFLTRVGCEHRARAQLCEGQWGKLPQCPAGVANDHGQ